MPLKFCTLEASVIVRKNWMEIQEKESSVCLGTITEAFWKILDMVTLKLSYYYWKKFVYIPEKIFYLFSFCDWWFVYPVTPVILSLGQSSGIGYVWKELLDKFIRASRATSKQLT
jgi:hypothetical protein